MLAYTVTEAAKSEVLEGRHEYNSLLTSQDYQ